MFKTGRVESVDIAIRLELKLFLLKPLSTCLLPATSKCKRNSWQIFRIGTVRYAEGL